MVKGKGFTLIEMMVVIVILATLAIIAAPRFLNLSHDARSSMLKGVASEYQQAVSFANHKWAIEGRANQAQVNLPGYVDGQLDINDVGFPIGIDKNAALSAPYNIGRGQKACAELFQTLLDTSLTASHQQANIETVDFFARRQSNSITLPDGSTTTAQSKCYYIYTKDSFNLDPEVAKHVIWYDSRTGDVTYITNS
ncbi:type II secretion system protein [Vibrio gallicus]|uniref:type II secretion system protein n=1 Tax=Vibrio gallicus TaxID=190897 RepID=UPI0029057C00|nr:prepilin-type N-terminal cleavage/methylation domain-containing protein [Vibrio gallicus]